MLPNMNIGGPIPPPGGFNMESGVLNLPGMPINNMISKVNTTDAILYVGNLHPSMDETRLFEIFRGYGAVKNCKLMKDLYTQESRGFAFVTFENQDDAQKAKDELNYAKFDDWEMRICFKKSPSDFKDESNIFIKNLSHKVTTKQLDEECSKYGEVLSCVIRNNEKGESLGYGYVQFSSEEEALKAIENLNEIELEGQQITVSKFVPSKNRQVAKKNIYMKNFPCKWKKDDVEKFLKEEIETQGETTSTGVYSTQKDDEPEKFFAFVAFEDEKAAEEVIKKFEGKKLSDNEEDEEFYIGFAQSKKQRKDLLKKDFQTTSNQTNIFVKSLKNDVTEEQLKEIFSEYGTITSICLKKMETKVPYTEDPLKFGFINYKTSDMAKQAIINYQKNVLLSNLIHDKHNRNVPYVCFAQSKRVRLAYLKMKKRMQNFDHFSLIGNPFQQMQSNLPVNGIMGAPMPFQPVGIPAFPPMNKQMNQNKNLDFGLNTPSQEMSHPNSLPNEKIKDVYNIEWLKQNQTEFINFSEEKQRNILGELMYEKVQNSGLTDQSQVSKITEFEEIIDILENEDSLHERINEAQEVILESDF